MANNVTAKKTTLPNGLMVISEAMPHIRTAAVGLWVKSGSRVEPAGNNVERPDKSESNKDQPISERKPTERRDRKNELRP